MTTEPKKREEKSISDAQRLDWLIAHYRQAGSGFDRKKGSYAIIAFPTIEIFENQNIKQAIDAIIRGEQNERKIL